MPESSSALTRVTQMIKVKYHTDIDDLKQVDGSDWIDLRCAEEVVVLPGEYIEIPLGVSIQLPKGYEAIVAPRSSTFKHYGILMVNSIGIIDEAYCGDGDEWRFPAYGTRETVIPKNARIAQFRLLKHQGELEILTATHLNNPARGGIGSTGKE